MSGPDYENDGLFLHAVDMFSHLLAASSTFQKLSGSHTPEYALSSIYAGGLEEDDEGPKSARAFVKVGSNLQIRGSTSGGYKTEMLAFDVYFEIPMPGTLRKYRDQYRWLLRQIGLIWKDMRTELRKGSRSGIYPDIVGMSFSQRPDVADFDADQGNYYGYADTQWTARGSAE
jgi:hypothetical protein